MPKNLSRFQRPRWRRRFFRKKGRDGGTQITVRHKLQRRNRPGWSDKKLLLPDFHDGGEDSEIFANKEETAQFPRPR